jgi:hypothetical protein
MDADQESLELAMALHRQLNAPQRRSRREIEEEKRLKEKQKREEEESTSSDSSDEDEEEGDEDDHNDNGSDQEQSKDEKEAVPLQGAAARRAKRRRRKSPPRHLDPHEIAAATAVQKATKNAKSKNGGPIGQTHCKCFVSGIPWGVIIPKEALESRQSLCEAAAKAFEKDGFVCRAEELEVSIVAGASKKVVHFPAISSLVAGKTKKTEEGLGGAINNKVEGGDSAKKEDSTNGEMNGNKEKKISAPVAFEEEEQQHECWAAATQHAQRVYLSKIKLHN